MNDRRFGFWRFVGLAVVLLVCWHLYGEFTGKKREGDLLLFLREKLTSDDFADYLLRKHGAP